MGLLLWLADVARDAGLTVVEVDGWQDRGRPEMVPVGVVAHHTAGPTSGGDIPTLPILVNGRTGLPGPLCHYGLGRSGTVYVVASGKANHAGLGQWQGDVFIDHSYQVVGIEAEHPGTSGTPWPDVQLEAYHRLSAAILVQIGRPSSNLCGHKEWAQPPESTPNRKPDPVDLNMNAFRTRVAEVMEELTMGLTAEEVQFVKDMYAAIQDRGSDGSFAGFSVDLIRKERGLPLHAPETGGAGVDADLRAKFNTHKHAEGTTAEPREVDQI